MSSDGSDDEDYDVYMETHHAPYDTKRFPIHDACEFESLEALKVRSVVAGSVPLSRCLHAAARQTDLFLGCRCLIFSSVRIFLPTELNSGTH